MILISLRGNINGIEKNKENKPYTVNQVLKSGMHCWVDVWWKDGEFYLGTFEPTYPVNPSFLKIYAIWANAMDFTTLLKLTELNSAHRFFYKGEPLITSSGHIITDTIIDGYESSTILMTDESSQYSQSLYGIVSNNILEFAS
jgi:hypothetical protein